MSGIPRLMGHSVRLMAVVMLALVGSAGLAAAQGVTTVTLTVEASPPWTEEVSQDAVPGATPGQVLSDGESLVLVLARDLDDPDQERLDALEEFDADPASIVTIDQGETDTISYWLDVMSVSGEVWGAFTLVRSSAESGSQVFTMYLGPVDRFAAGLTTAQKSIAVNGAPIFESVGPEGLQELLDANAGAVSVASPEAQDEEATEEAGEPGVEPTEEPADDEDKSGEGEGEDIPYADAGMVGPRQYVSPQFGVEIEWTSDWDLDEDFGEAVTSDPKTEIDSVSLLWSEERAAWLLVLVFGPVPGLTVPDVVNNIDAGVQEIFGEDSTVAMSSSSSGLGAAVILMDEGRADPTLIYEEYRFGGPNDAIVVVRMISVDPEVTQAAIEAASADITVDGEPILVYYPPADVAAVHAG